MLSSAPASLRRDAVRARIAGAGLALAWSVGAVSCRCAPAEDGPHETGLGSTAETADVTATAATAETADTAPSDTATPPSIPYAKLSAGEELTCWLDVAGEAGCRGGTRWELPEPPPGPFVDVAAAWSTACAVRTTGELACWGCDWVESLCEPPGGNRFVSVDGAGDHFCAEDTSGEVGCWSYYGTGPVEGVSYDTWAVGVTGFVGIRSGTGQADTAPEAGEPDEVLSEVGAGRSATCGILASDGTTRCWVYDGPDLPDGLAVIDGYDADFCYLTTTGLVDCARNHPDAARDGFDPAVEVFVSIAAGVDHACAVTADGRGFCWPRDGRPETSGIPTLVPP